MYSQERKNATQRKTFKHTGYKSKEKGSGVDAWSQHLNLHKQSILTNINKNNS